MLKEKIQQATKEALKKKQDVTLSTLRFLNSKIQNKEIEKQGELIDEEIVQILKKLIKELKEAAGLFEKGGRDELVAQNQEQIKILSAYLPAEMPDEELRGQIKKIVEANKPLFEKNPKALIGLCISKLKSKADPKRIVDMLNSLS